LAPEVTLQALARRFAALTAATDAKVHAANLIALVLAWNTPFYPLYVYFAAGPAGMRWTMLNLLVFPVFAAVPFITRQHPLAGRALLVAAGTLNTTLCIWLYGEAAGEQLFLLPCVTIAILLFRRSERAVMAGLLLLPVAAYFMLGHYGSPPFPHGASLLGLNVASVGVLTAFLAWVFAE
jgi:hypothetical protein